MNPKRLISTYSIVAIDRKNKVMGVGVQSHWFSVGSVVSWAEAGVGVVATQSIAEPSYGPLGLTLMRRGKTASEALKALLTIDPHANVRQVSMLDTEGNIATHTGEDCIPEAGHIIGDDFSVQANMMKSDQVWPSMAKQFIKSKNSLQWRILSALEAAERAGGDIRGRQSACIVIVKTQPSRQPWADKILELRVEDHPDPLGELRRLLTLHEAYEHANKGDSLVAEGKIEEAMQEYKRAVELAPQVEELKFWQGLTMLFYGKEEDGLILLKEVLTKDKNYRQLLKSLPKTKLYKIKESDVQKIISKIDS